MWTCPECGANAEDHIFPCPACGAGSHLELVGGGLTVTLAEATVVGRDAFAGWTASRAHVRLFPRAGQWTLCALSSAAETILDGNRCERGRSYPLPGRFRLRLGRVEVDGRVVG